MEDVLPDRASRQLSAEPQNSENMKLQSSQFSQFTTEALPKNHQILGSKKLLDGLLRSGATYRRVRITKMILILIVAQQTMRKMGTFLHSSLGTVCITPCHYESVFKVLDLLGILMSQVCMKWRFGGVVRLVISKMRLAGRLNPADQIQHTRVWEMKRYHAPACHGLSRTMLYLLALAKFRMHAQPHNSSP